MLNPLLPPWVHVVYVLLIVLLLAECIALVAFTFWLFPLW